MVTEVAKSLEFSSKIHDMADRVIRGMTNGGSDEYNAVHLRIERDARDWSQIMGGEAVRMDLQHMLCTFCNRHQGVESILCCMPITLTNPTFLSSRDPWSVDCTSSKTPEISRGSHGLET